MKYDLDLRSPDFKNRRNIVRGKFLSYAYCMAVILILIFIFMAADQYRIWLHSDLERLNAELETKNKSTVPLIKMMAEIEAFNQKIEVEKNLRKGCQIKADHLRQLMLHQAQGITIEHLSLNAEGNIEIRGKSKSLHDTTLYTGRLKNLPLIDTAEVKTAELNELGICTFTISAIIDLDGEAISDVE